MDIVALILTMSHDSAGGPAFLRGIDEDPFTQDSISKRLPNIVKSIAERNPWLASEQAKAIL